MIPNRYIALWGSKGSLWYGFIAVRAIDALNHREAIEIAKATKFVVPRHLGGSRLIAVCHWTDAKKLAERLLNSILARKGRHLPFKRSRATRTRRTSTRT